MKKVFVLTIALLLLICPLKVNAQDTEYEKDNSLNTSKTVIYTTLGLFSIFSLTLINKVHDFKLQSNI